MILNAHLATRRILCPEIISSIRYEFILSELSYHKIGNNASGKFDINGKSGVFSRNILICALILVYRGTPVIASMYNVVKCFS